MCRESSLFAAHSDQIFKEWHHNHPSSLPLLLTKNEDTRWINQTTETITPIEGWLSALYVLMLFNFGGIPEH